MKIMKLVAVILLGLTLSSCEECDKYKERLLRDRLVKDKVEMIRRVEDAARRGTRAQIERQKALIRTEEMVREATKRLEEEARELAAEVREMEAQVAAEEVEVARERRGWEAEIMITNEKANLARARVILREMVERAREAEWKVRDAMKEELIRLSREKEEAWEEVRKEIEAARALEEARVLGRDEAIRRAWAVHNEEWKAARARGEVE